MSKPLFLVAALVVCAGLYYVVQFASKPEWETAIAAVLCLLGGIRGVIHSKEMYMKRHRFNVTNTQKAVTNVVGYAQHAERQAGNTTKKRQNNKQTESKKEKHKKEKVQEETIQGGKNRRKSYYFEHFNFERFRKRCTRAMVHGSTV
jgi:hypothetical protein